MTPGPDRQTAVPVKSSNRTTEKDSWINCKHTKYTHTTNPYLCGSVSASGSYLDGEP